VWGRCGLADLGAGAPAAIQPSIRAQLLERCAVRLQALALARRSAVPIDSQPLQVGEHARLVLASRALRVEILDAQHETGRA
jgi:hypothetical protein